MILSTERQQEDYVLPLAWAPVLTEQGPLDLTPEDYDAANHWLWSQFERVSVPCVLVDGDGWYTASHDANHLTGPRTVGRFAFLI